LARDRYVPNVPWGYRAIMRDHSTQMECLGVAQHLAIDAQARGGGPYYCDVIPGMNRAHARVTTDGWRAFFAERKYRALSKSLPSRGQKRRGTWKWTP
jgi:hypothetical protein